MHAPHFENVYDRKDDFIEGICRGSDRHDLRIFRRSCAQYHQRYGGGKGEFENKKKNTAHPVQLEFIDGIDCFVARRAFFCLIAADQYDAAEHTQENIIAGENRIPIGKSYDAQYSIEYGKPDIDDKGQDGKGDRPEAVAGKQTVCERVRLRPFKHHFLYFRDKARERINRINGKNRADTVGDINGPLHIVQNDQRNSSCDKSESNAPNDTEKGKGRLFEEQN